jgi:AraC-like DNA-binding protein
MENLFRLVLTRPPVVQDESAPSIRLAQESAFQTALAQAQQNQNPRRALKAAARQFMTTPNFIGDPIKLPLHAKLKAMGSRLDTLEKNTSVSNTEVSNIVKDAFGETPAKLIQDYALDGPTADLKDSLIAIKLIPEEHRLPIEDLTRQLRDLELIREVAADSSFPGTGANLRRFRRRSVMLPTAVDLRSILSTLQKQKQLEQQRKEEEEKKRQRAEAKLELYKRLNGAIGELTNLHSDHLHVTPQKPDPGFLVPDAFRPTRLVMQEITQREQVSKLDVLRLESAIKVSEKVELLTRFHPAEGLTAETASKRSLSQLFISGKAPFTPLAQAETTFRLKSEIERLLSASTQELLKERNLSVSAIPLDTIVERLRAETTSLTKELDTLLGRPVQRSLKRVGNTMVMTSVSMASTWTDLVVSGHLATGVPLPFDMSVPISHGSIAPAGIADLLVVRQQLVRYEGADVAHIENVLRGEKKTREHTSRRETEEFNLRETETTTSEERELESTTRFEMSRETSQTIREDAALKAGLTVSGKYGPTVEFSASVEGSVSRSKEEATKTAASFSQDVTERSATKITERVLERASLRVTNEVIDKNTHTLDNVTGPGHISGVYQWVTKLYQAQMFNYGIRMMYDFMVPEPGAFLISSLQGAHANAVELEKPAPFTLRPDQITEAIYFSWIQQYGATDVQPPPEEFKTKSVDFKAGGGEHGTNYNHAGQVQIDEGYKAIHGTVAALKNIWDSTATVDVVLGSRTHRFPLGDWVWSTALSEERDSIPFALDTMQVADVEVAIEVKCQRTERAMLKWQLETHAKLTTAYKARLSEYEEKLAALQIQAGVAIRGRNPFLNQELMHDELKKHCITILTEQHFDLFDAIQTGSFNIPQINLIENAAEGPYVRFFEQAFEWEQMTWLTYPYFWGRKSQWHERVAYEDIDPAFNQFLKAGYCRVVVPVRPGFEGAVDHFTTYGEVWNGGPLPTISNPLYLPIADEIAERLDRPGDEVPQGDPWLVRVPTTLVHLRSDDQLPRWKQDASGEWVEE